MSLFKRKATLFLISVIILSTFSVYVQADNFEDQSKLLTVDPDKILDTKTTICEGYADLTAENSANSVIQAVADMSGATSLAQKANPNAPWNQPVVDNKSDTYWGNNKSGGGNNNTPTKDLN